MNPDKKAVGAPPQRRAKVLNRIPKGAKGIEIGPWHSPLLPKKEGWQVLTLDVFTQEALKRRAESEPDVPKEAVGLIEEVDLLGSATELERLVTQAGHSLASFDFVLSSHNFEHLPDPIRFLQAVEKVLRPGGILVMVLPDRRTCFDYLRPASSLGQVLDAYFLKRSKPSPSQVFDFQVNRASRSLPGGASSVYFPLSGFSEEVHAREDLDGALKLYRTQLENPDATYMDAHCWTFSPAEFKLLVEELRSLKFTALVLEHLEMEGADFIVEMRKLDGQELSGQKGDDVRKKSLLQEVVNERIHAHRAWEGRWNQMLKRTTVTILKAFRDRFRRLLKY